MPRKSYTLFPTKQAATSQPSIPSSKPVRKTNFEAPDPADIYAQRYRQSLPPHPEEFKPLRPPPPPPSSASSQQASCEAPLLRPSRDLEMRPLTDIGRHTSSSPKRLARNASNASTRTRQNLPKINEVPELDSDAISVESSNLSRSSSISSRGAIDASCISNRSCLMNEETEESVKMNRREATIQASIERTSWMIDEEAGKDRGSKDLVEHINYVISAWQRDKK